MKIVTRIEAVFRFANSVVRNIEPRQWPDKEPEDILRDNGFNDRMIETFRGRCACLWIATQKLKRAMWEALITDPRYYRQSRHNAKGGGIADQKESK